MSHLRTILTKFSDNLSPVVMAFESCEQATFVFISIEVYYFGSQETLNFLFIYFSIAALNTHKYYHTFSEAENQL